MTDRQLRTYCSQLFLRSQIKHTLCSNGRVQEAHQKALHPVVQPPVGHPTKSSLPSPETPASSSGPAARTIPKPPPMGAEAAPRYTEWLAGSPGSITAPMTARS